MVIRSPILVLVLFTLDVFHGSGAMSVSVSVAVSNGRTPIPSWTGTALAEPVSASNGCLLATGLLADNQLCPSVFRPLCVRWAAPQSPPADRAELSNLRILLVTIEGLPATLRWVVSCPAPDSQLRC